MLDDNVEDDSNDSGSTRPMIERNKSIEKKLQVSIRKMSIVISSFIFVNLTIFVALFVSLEKE